MEAVHGTNFHAIGQFTFDASVCYYKGHIYSRLVSYAEVGALYQGSGHGTIMQGHGLVHHRSKNVPVEF